MTAMFLAWPIIHLLRSVRYTRRYGRGVKQETGLGRAKQLLQQLELGYRFPVVFILATEITEIGSDWYYRRRLYRADRRARLTRSRPAFATVFWLASIRRRWETQTTAGEPTKMYWYRTLTGGNLATIPVLAHISSAGVETKVDPDSTHWTGDLFAKPDDGGQGEGAMRFRFVEPDCFEAIGGHRFSRNELFELLAGTGRDYVIQPHTRSHPAIAALVGSEALATVRVFTMLGADGEPKLIPTAFFKIPKPGSDTDNFHSGGMICGLDTDTGVLRSAFSRNLEHLRENPHNGAVVENFQLPDWQAGVELVIQGHRLARDELMVIGWDLALSENGPVLVEGNLAPGTFEYLDGDRMLGDLPELNEILAYLAFERMQQSRTHFSDRRGPLVPGR